MIQIQNLSKAYQKADKKAVDSLDLEIPKGSIFGFLGPNGAGKSSTIRMICGILQADSGNVYIDGINLREKPLEAKMRFGLVPDNPEVFTRLKAREYLNFLADVYKVDTPTRKERINHYAELFTLKDVLESRIGSFSHGMKQKLVLIGSLLHDPENWILDEPLVGLDPEAAFNLKEEMNRRIAEGKSVFFSTHVMEVAEKICTHLCIIKQGKGLFTGTMQELKNLAGKESSLEDVFLDMIRKDPEGGEA